jgi:hypothetical protein
LVVSFDHGPRNTWTLIADSQHSRTDSRLVIYLNLETHFKSLNYSNYAKVYRIITST